jgi:pimeloyl-[acyl-carrier protein] synthase
MVDDGRSVERLSLNPFEPAFWVNPYRFYPSLVVGPPLRLPSLFPAIVVARYSDVVSVLRAPQRFSSRPPDVSFVRKFNPFGDAPTVLLSDPPLHTRLRRLIAQYFRPGRVEELSLSIYTVIEQLLARIAALGEFDAVADFAEALPAAINAEILGVRFEDVSMIKAWSDEIFTSARRSLMLAAATVKGGGPGSSPADAERSASSAIATIDLSIPDSAAHAVAALHDYFTREIGRRRERPGLDFVSAMVRAQDEGSLSTGELLGLIELVLFAGSETTSSLIANGLLALSTRRDELALLKSNPDLMASAIEEILRYDSPVQMVMRYATADTNIDGTAVPNGAAILVVLGAANRDPAQFNLPERFDVRRHPNEHLAFGEGIHTCLGAYLARLEGKIAIAAIIERFPEFRLRERDAQLIYSGSLLSRTLSSLPMLTS